MKKCRKCLVEKTIDEYFKSGKYPSGKVKIRGDCKACSSADTKAWRTKQRVHYNAYMAKYRIQNPDKIRAHEIKKLYGLSAEDLLRMVNEQDNKCKICGRPPRGKRPLAIDHCHATGRVRGLLCYRCNTAMSMFDNKDLFQKSLAYLSS